jgi:two-component system nitrogen regulation response regulator NtrX
MEQKLNILISDDNVEFCRTVADIVQSFGYETITMHEPQATMDFIDKNIKKLSVILLDIEFGPGIILSGINILEHCRKYHPAIPVIMITGKGTVETAVKATKLGAVNFIEKNTLSKEKLHEVLTSAISKLNLKGEAKEIQKFLESTGIIGKSKKIIEVGDSIIRFGRTDLNVLITGETGTGKKLVAKAIHSVSRRAKYPMVTVDIPNIPRELFQSELFGHYKGSFTGAHDSKKGLFHQANRGTLFLDEIGDLSLDLQSSLFIPIEEKLVRRVGSSESEELDVRFVSATDKDLLYAMKESRFREQLYHRLRECEIHIPPLRERVEDIPEIIDFYLHKHNLSYDDSKAFSPAAIEYMQEHEWTGNVREMASVVRLVLQTVSSMQIEVSDLHRIISNKALPNNGDFQSEALLSSGRTLREDLQELDKKKIESTLEKCNGNVSKAAAMLDISRETLHNKIRKYGINTQLFRVKN